MMNLRLTTVALVGGVALATLMPAASTVAQPKKLCTTRLTVSQVADVGASCRLAPNSVVTLAGELQIAVPGPGITANVSALRTRPSTGPTQLSVYRSSTDQVVVQVDDEPFLGSPSGVAEWQKSTAAGTATVVSPRTAQVAAAAPSWCGSVGQFRTHPGRWPNAKYSWTYNSRTQPDSGALDAIFLGFKFITDNASACSSSYPTAATHSYRGSTTRYTWGTQDNGNVVGWAGFGLDTLALAYWWTDGSVKLEADVAFNNRITNWSTSPAGTVPSNRYDVISVATHEAGHVFGLEHVDSLPKQVMYPSFATGENRRVKRMGDLGGMWAMY